MIYPCMDCPKHNECFDHDKCIHYRKAKQAAEELRRKEREWTEAEKSRRSSATKIGGTKNEKSHHSDGCIPTRAENGRRDHPASTRGNRCLAG